MEKPVVHRAEERSSRREAVFDAFRRWGYLHADLDRFGRIPPVSVPELQVEGPDAEAARRLYCGTLAAEFMHIPDPERRKWMIGRMEAEPLRLDRSKICEQLARAELFEAVVQRRHVGARRFSIEGIASLIPLLSEIIETSAGNGVREVVLGTPHRGRLNIILNIVGRSAVDVFAQFLDVDPRSVLGGGDVKYHLGANGDFQTRNNGTVRVSLVSNPSHVEAVDPVVLGRTWAKQNRLGRPGRRRVTAVILHGDAGFAGQGMASECLNLADLAGFTVGGTIHVIVNNLIGFTAAPESLHSSRFSSDAAKRLPVPILHVNAEDPDAVVRAGRIAATFRAEFQTDVVVDLIGFRKWGHSEIDDPTLTQPLLYERIGKRPAAWEVYAEKAGVDRQQMESRVEKELENAFEEASTMEHRAPLHSLPGYWRKYRGGLFAEGDRPNTAISREQIANISEEITSLPAGFTPHRKVRKGLDERARMGRGEQAVDWATAEAWAFASLLQQGIPVRLSGEDTRRGTFNQRHAVLFDAVTGREYVPLARPAIGRAMFACHDSPLSEASVLGFEYGVTRDLPEGLVLWEAQFGDFSNGAQVIIDQFVAAGEDKWGLLSGLVLLLPHGYDGQGPEHSSARPERLLQLAAEDNMRICQPSTAAQYFHLLRGQALTLLRKPLVVLTPKSMLRNPAVRSTLEDFARGGFRPVVGDEQVKEPERLLVCTGKIIHLLRDERSKRGDTRTAIVSVEQLYPFPEVELRDMLNAPEIVWVQEEPANMGALGYVLPILRRLSGRRVRSVKRSPSASPATGSSKAHQIEEDALIRLAFPA